MKAVFKEYVLDYVVYNGHNYDEVKEFVGYLEVEQIDCVVGSTILKSLEIGKTEKVYKGNVIIKHPNGNIKSMTYDNFYNKCYLLNDFKVENTQIDTEKSAYLYDLVSKLEFLKNRPSASSNNLFTITKGELLKIFDICLSFKDLTDEIENDKQYHVHQQWRMKYFDKKGNLIEEDCEVI